MLNNEYPPLGGGTGTVNQEIITFLKNKKNIQIDLITGSSDTQNSIENISSNINIYKIGLNNNNVHHASNIELIKYAIKAFFMAKKMHKTSNYDMSFAWSTVPAGFVSFLLNYLYKLPFVVRVGGPDIPGYEKRYRFVYKFITPLIKRIWKKSQKIITKCQSENDMILAINDKLPLYTIYNGIDTDKFLPRKYKKTDNMIKVICVARLIQRKGQEVLIEAIAHLKNAKGIEIKCDLVGDGDKKENYKKQVNNLDISNLISFTSFVSRNKIVDKYNDADIFVLPSYNEGMSNSVLEAMACGLPIILTDVGGTKELLTEGVNGFVFEKSNHKELAAILEKLYLNPQLVKEMAIKSREKAKMFNWSTIGDEYLKLFEQIAEQKK